jgi:excisionase family DNA binding protein
MERLLDYNSLSEATGLPVRTLRTLANRGQIPFLKLGHRLVRFQPSKVFRALERRTVKEVGT